MTHRVRTFGGVTVTDAAGIPVSSIERQRRVLALLALLAVAGERGLTRDKIVGYLWPESDAERARHSLTQALYAARRLLGADDLFDAGPVVHLNPRAIGSDVADLEAALDAGDAERALAIYTGPFLDGFFVAGAAEFEQWVTVQRARLEERVVRAGTAAADREAAAGATRSALALRRRLVEVRPHDSALATALVAALADAGDRAEALRVAQVHEALLREQFEIAPDLAFFDAVRRARNSTTAAAAPSATFDHARPVPTERDAPRASVLARSHRIVRRSVIGIAAAALVIGIGGLAAVGLERADGTGAAPSPSTARTFLVAPFNVAGASRSLAFLRRGMPELLTPRLDDDSNHWAGTAGDSRLWRMLPADTAPPSRATMLRVAREAGARWVAAGNVVGGSDHIVIEASLVNVASGDVRTTERVEGSADSLSRLVDAVAVRLLVSAAGDDRALVDHPPNSLTALRAYLAAQAAYRASNFATARDGYARALEYDSTFAPAALRLALTTERLRGRLDAEPAVMTAWKARRMLGPTDDARLAALAGPRFPAPSPAGAQLDAWQRVVRLQPSRADAWFDFASHLFYEGDLLGVPGALERARTAVERALVLDPNDVAARALALELRIRAIDDGRERGDVEALEAQADSLGVFALPTRWHLAQLQGDSDELHVLRDTLPALDHMTLRSIVMASVFGQIGLDDGWRAASWLRRRSRTLTERVDAELATHSVALNSGRVSDALAATTRLSQLRPDSHAYLRLRVLDALYASGDSAAADSAAQALASEAALPALEIPWARRAQASDACVVAQWRLAHGDTTGVARTVALLRAAPLGSDLPPVSASPIACAGLLDAMLAVQLHARNADDRLAALDSLLFTGVTAGNAASYVYIALARLHQRTGDANGALTAIRRRPFLSGWAPYLTAAWLEESRLADAVGDGARARAAYARYSRASGER
ncbi:MAG TPA: BTAD domain-containing putative transcriptional regulator [Gemmatimonadaceae bacterium]|nr:BTAD domain-containing putative transcriptional regulator [Gemmatimonadaceae bacterium]